MADEQHEDQDSGIAALRARAEQASAAEQRAIAAERRVAFLEAGVDLNTPLGGMFHKAYEGELTPEAIKAEAIKVGAIKTETSSVETKPDTTMQDTRQSLSSGTGAGDQQKVDPNPYDEASKERARLLGEGRTGEEADAAFIGAIRQAGLKGDARVFPKAPEFP